MYSHISDNRFADFFLTFTKQIFSVQINFVQSACYWSLLQLHGKCQRAENRYAQLHGDSQRTDTIYAQLHGECQRADHRLNAKKYTKMMLTCIIEI